MLSLKNVATYKKPFLRNSTQCLCSSPKINIIAKNDLIPEFVSSYIQICDTPEFAKPYIDKTDCATSLYIPSSDEQFTIMDTLHKLSEKINIEPIQPYLIHYMIRDDAEKANALLIAYQEYINSLGTILEMIKELPN